MTRAKVSSEMINETPNSKWEKWMSENVGWIECMEWILELDT